MVSAGGQSCHGTPSWKGLDTIWTQSRAPRCQAGAGGDVARPCRGGLPWGRTGVCWAHLHPCLFLGAQQPPRWHLAPPLLRCPRCVPAPAEPGPKPCVYTSGSPPYKSPASSNGRQPAQAAPDSCEMLLGKAFDIRVQPPAQSPHPQPRCPTQRMLADQTRPQRETCTPPKGEQGGATAPPQGHRPGPPLAQGGRREPGAPMWVPASGGGGTPSQPPGVLRWLWEQAPQLQALART